VQFLAQLQAPIFGVTIKTKEGMTVYGANSETLDATEFRDVGGSSSTIQLQAAFRCSLAPGDYFISVGVATVSGGEVVPHDRRFDAIHLQVAHQQKFFGLADLNLEMNLLDTRS
jgi:lipopolysaccharide transport system ATP-binding protein